MTHDNPNYISEEDAALNCAAGRHDWSLFGEGPAAYCLHCAATRRNVNAPVIPAPNDPPASDAARLLTGGQLGIMDVAIAENEIWDWTSETLPKPGDNNYLEYHQWRHDIALLEKAGYLQCMPRSIGEPWHWIPTRKYATYLKQQPPASNGTTAGERDERDLDDDWIEQFNALSEATPEDRLFKSLVALQKVDEPILCDVCKTVHRPLSEECPGPKVNEPQRTGPFDHDPLGTNDPLDKPSEQPAPRPPSKAVKLSKLTHAQANIGHQLLDGWTIVAPTPKSMTRWRDDKGHLKASACSISSLKAMEKNGMVQWVVGQWQLTEAGKVAVKKWWDEFDAALRDADEEARKS